jgi:hypothetical protein
MDAPNVLAGVEIGERPRHAKDCQGQLPGQWIDGEAVRLER